MVKLSVNVAMLLVVMVGYSSAVPAPDSHEELGAVGRLLHFFAVEQPQTLSRVRRQTTACSSPVQCLPPGVTNTSEARELAQCIAGQCVCMDCFAGSPVTNSCQLCPDYPYDNQVRRCGLDGRPRQLTAFLLSLFLSSTGAANFHIGQTGLGGGQIAIMAIVLLFSYLMCCLPCCLACCTDDVKGSIVFILLMLLLTLVVIGCSLAMSAWWIADLVIFATNQRLSGNGCTLTPNL